MHIDGTPAPHENGQPVTVVQSSLLPGGTANSSCLPAGALLFRRRALHAFRQHAKTVDDRFLVFQPGHFHPYVLEIAQDLADGVVVAFFDCVGPGYPGYPKF
ncbi:hypothetical protein [Pararhizobium sp. DWP1-1-3]|uniref:hypothetical protein n=1 Tax=Pararhizobium sp. DWP1-1-3 TaxID=2804652 RepID=UPI003CEB036E